MNAVFTVLIASSVLIAALTGRMDKVMASWVDSAKGAVEIAFGLIGYMVLFLGVIQVLRDAGAVGAVARLLAPVMRRLFPEVPPEHPAMGAMLMNLTANVFGLGNAATPFGLKAMQELNRLNLHPGVATNAMVLFLTINTSGVAVLPTGVIALRASLGSADPGGIFLPTLLSTMTSTAVGTLVAILLARRQRYAVERYVDRSAGEAAPSSIAAGIAPVDASELLKEERSPTTPARKAVAWVAAAVFLVGLVHSGLYRMGGIDLFGWGDGVTAAAPAAAGEAAAASDAATPLAPAPAPALLSFGDFFAKELASQWLIPALLLFTVLFGWARGVKVYESAIKGARDGFQMFTMIVPFLVLILVSVSMFRASGALDALILVLSPVTSLIGFPAEALPMALLRPLSGGGAYAVMTETMKTYGPDSFPGYLVSVISGSMETTFYVLAVYFGSAQIRSVRHAIPACLAADVAGVLAALVFTRLLLV
jgi:spore maturation protein SpmA